MMVAVISCPCQDFIDMPVRNDRIPVVLSLLMTE